MASSAPSETAASPYLADFAGLFDLVFANAVDGILLSYTDGRVHAVNPAACRILGRSEEEIRRLGRGGITSPGDPRIAEMVEERLREGHARVETTLVRPDGTLVPVELTTAVLGEPGPANPAIVIIRDLSGERRAGAERLRLEAALVQAQKVESLGALATGVAHDFNNLLGVVLANADTVGAALRAGTPARDALDDIREAALRGGVLVRQLLAYAGRARVARRPIDLTDVVRDVDHLIRASVPRKVSLALQLAERAPLVGDRGQLGQVVMQLVLNAAEAIGEGEGRIGISTGVERCPEGHPALALADPDLPPGPYAWLEVADDGPGMSAELAARIFDPFVSTRALGRGLGLATVAGVVRAHGGVVQLETAEGRGSRFRIWLPAGGPGSVELPDELAATSERGGLVLVVDDEPLVRRYARRVLEAAGFSVLEAADGVSSVDVFREHANEIEVVLLDYDMPRMNGAEAFEAIRAVRADVRVLISTGYGGGRVLERLEGRGLAGTLEKPYAGAQLLAAVKAARCGA